MRFFAPIAAFVLGAAALPASNVARDEPANILAQVQNAFEPAPVVDGAEPFVIAASSKRSVAVEAVEDTLAKRATLIVDVWQDSDQHGRHEGLYTDSKLQRPEEKVNRTVKSDSMQPTGATIWETDGMTKSLHYLCPMVMAAISSGTTTATTMTKVRSVLAMVE